MVEILKYSFASRETLPMIKETKQRGSWYRAEITPILPIAGQKFPRYFEGHIYIYILLLQVGLYPVAVVLQ
jgi:hypothetical protein